jgi:uncharacterized protein YlxW (UPF0749 family)
VTLDVGYHEEIVLSLYIILEWQSMIPSHVFFSRLIHDAITVTVIFSSKSIYRARVSLIFLFLFMYRITRTIAPRLRQQTRNVNVFAEFMNSVRRQVKENEQLQKDVKLLSQESQKVTESEAMKNAKKAISKTSEATSKVLGAVGTAVDATLQTPVVKATGEAISKTAEIVADVTQKVWLFH